MREHAVCLVILLLLSHEEETYLSIVYHELYLLLAACGIERYCHGTHAPRSEVAENILHGVLREYSDVLLRFDTEVEQCVGHDFHFV